MLCIIRERKISFTRVDYLARINGLKGLTALIGTRPHDGKLVLDIQKNKIHSQNFPFQRRKNPCYYNGATYNYNNIAFCLWMASRWKCHSNFKWNPRGGWFTTLVRAARQSSKGDKSPRHYLAVVEFFVSPARSCPTIDKKKKLSRRAGLASTPRETRRPFLCPRKYLLEY